MSPSRGPGVLVEVEVGEHRIAVRRGRWWVGKRVLYDGREVADRPFSRSGIYQFWVMEDGKEVRYEVHTGSGGPGGVGTITRNGRRVYSAA